MSVYGLVVETAWVANGSTLIADTEAGATTLTVEWSGDFDSEGGTLELNGVRMAYVGIVEGEEPDDPDMLTLADPLAANAAEGDRVSPVSGGQVNQNLIAYVDAGEGDNVEVILPFEQRTMWPEGVYEDPVGVWLTDDLGGIESVPDQIPTLDLTYADPTTIPEPQATEPPATSPSVRVSGTASSIVAVAENIAATDRLDWYIDGTLRFPDTRSTVVVFNDDAGGSPLVAGQQYGISVVAHNSAGSAAPSEVVYGTLNSGVDAETILGMVAAGFVLAGSIQVGNITISPDTGITIPLATGGSIHFPANGSEATIEAALRTSDLVVSGGLSVNGASNQINGRLTLASGVTDPNRAASVSNIYAKQVLELDITWVNGRSFRGLADSAAGADWATTWINSDWSGRLATFSKTSGAMTDSVTFADLTDLTCVDVCRGGMSYFVLGRRWNASGGRWDYRVHRYDMGLNLTGSWYVLTAGGARVTAPNGSAVEGAIAFDASDSTVWVATRLPSGNYAFRHHALNGDYLGVVTTTDEATDAIAPGLHIGAADVGTNLFYVATNNGIRAYTPAGARAATHDFGATTQDWNGLHWDGTRFWSMQYQWGSGQKPRVMQFSTDLAATLDVAYAWEDVNLSGGPHTTTVSPRTTAAVPRRGYVQVSLGAPPFDGSSDGANATALYTATTAGGTLRKLSTTQHSASVTILLDPAYAASGALVPAANTFNTTTNVGELQSSAAGNGGPSIDLRGSGYARLWDLLQAGTVSATPASAGTDVDVPVAFLTPFSAPPTVVVGPITKSAAINRVRATGITNAGFTLTLNRSDTTTTVCHWQAVAATQ